MWWLLAVASVATADMATPEGPPLSLSVTTGVVTGSGPWRAAPAVDLATAVPLGSTRLSFVAGVGAWTFGAAGFTGSSTELVASAGVGVNGALTRHWSWSVGGSPAIAVTQASTTPVTARPGFLVTPSIQYATRRRTLSLIVGTQALVLTDGLRLGVTAGVAYTFR